LGVGDIRNILTLAVSATLAACSSGNAATTAPDPANSIAAQAVSGVEAVENESEDVGAMNGAVMNAAAMNAAYSDEYPDGHLPAN
jgi:hypothetical protein